MEDNTRLRSNLGPKQQTKLKRLNRQIEHYEDDLIPNIKENIARIEFYLKDSKEPEDWDLYEGDKLYFEETLVEWEETLERLKTNKNLLLDLAKGVEALKTVAKILCDHDKPKEEKL